MNAGTNQPFSEVVLRYRIHGKEQEVHGSSETEAISLTISEQEGRFVAVVAAKQGITLLTASQDLEQTFDPSAPILANGYQSWTQTQVFLPGESLNDLRLTPRLTTRNFHFKAYGSQAFWPLPTEDLLGLDYSCVAGETPFFIGSFNFARAYLLIWFRRKNGTIHLESDVEGKTLRSGESFVLFDYMTGVSGEKYWIHFTARTDQKLLGYTSWYNHYQDINEEKILTALEHTDSRFDLFQIDDGFETFVGDWFDIDPVKFPRGLEPIVQEIHEKGMLAGIWLAPFVAEIKSRLLKEHPEWIARDIRGQLIYAGCNWSGDCPLDLNDPEVVNYIRETLRYYVNLGFDFFKLDFLYAVNLKPLKGRTRAETSEFAYELLREELGERILLGCGATLSNGAGRFDYCRIGPDVSLSFDDAFYMRIFHPERTSTKVTLLNTMFRQELDGRFFANDPDVFLLRDDNNKMSWKQRQALTKINALYGSLLMTSDDIGAYDDAKKAVLEEALELFYHAKPLETIRQDDLIDIRYEMNGTVGALKYHIESGELQ